MDTEQLARRARYQARKAYQRMLDEYLTPVSEVPAELVREHWEPMEQFLKEGPDVGEPDFPESKGGQRVN
jgi:hypothetical protein